MKPSIGRIIIVVSPQAASNGSDRAPGIITRVWSNPQQDTIDGPAMVNATILPDLSVPQHASSIQLFDTEDDARENAPPGMPFAYWPTRV